MCGFKSPLKPVVAELEAIFALESLFCIFDLLVMVINI